MRYEALLICRWLAQDHAQHGEYLYTVANAAAHLSMDALELRQVDSMLTRVLLQKPRNPMGLWLHLEIALRLRLSPVEIEVRERKAIDATCGGSVMFRSRCVSQPVTMGHIFAQRLLSGLRAVEHDISRSLDSVDAHAKHTPKPPSAEELPIRGFFHVNGIREDHMDKDHPKHMEGGQGRQNPKFDPGYPSYTHGHTGEL